MASWRWLKRLTEHYKRKSLRWLTWPDPALQKAHQSFERFMRQPFKIRSWEDFRSQLKEFSQGVILLGDIHTLNLSQKGHKKILEFLSSQFDASASVVLHLECILESYQNRVDAYMAHPTDDESFLNAVGWTSHWGFPWTYYKPYFDWARENRVKVYALGMQPQTVLQPDEGMAQFIRRRIAQHPQAWHLVIVGEFHLLDSGLPFYLKPWLPKDYPIIRIFSVSEPAYWKLWRDQKVFQTELIQFRSGDWSLMASSPWIKWQQTYLWVNHLIEEDSTPDPWGSSAWREQAMDLYVQWFNRLANTQGYGQDWEVRRWDEDWQIPSEVNLDFRWMIKLLSHNHILVFPDLRKLVLPQDTFNTIIEAAAIAWWMDHQAWDSTLWYQLTGEEMLWWQMMVFFLTKWVNPKRRPETLDQIHRRYARDPKKSRLEYRVWQSWLGLGKAVMHSRQKSLLPALGSDAWLVARYLGRILGDRLYGAYSHGEIKASEIWQSLKSPPQEGIQWLRRWLPTLWTWSAQSDSPQSQAS